jgi:hypothetical protein
MGLFPTNINEYVALMGIPRGPNSNVYLVDAANGSDSNPGTSFKAPLATIAAAYALCTANQHDVVLYLASSSGINLSAALTWSKNYTHLIGLCAPTQAAQRARIFQLSTLTGASPLLTISATGCIFKDFYIFQGVDDATSLINVSVTGGRNYFENVHFAGGGHATMAINGGASLHLNAAEENLFRHCTIGVDTIAAATGMAGVLFDGEAHRNVFEDCLFSMYAGHAGAIFAEVVDSTGIDRYTIFKRCLFSNTASMAMTQAFAIPAGMGAPRRIYLMDCALHGATDWDGNDRGVLFQNNGTITVGGNAGTMLTTVAA